MRGLERLEGGHQKDGKEEQFGQSQEAGILRALGPLEILCCIDENNEPK